MAEYQTSLKDLLVDDKEINEAMLAETLSDFIRIGKESGGLYPRAAFSDINSYRKTAVILLAQHAKEALGLADTEWLSPSEISELGGIKSGTVHPAVRKLEEMGLAESDDGNYRIPGPILPEVRRFIEEAKTE